MAEEVIGLLFGVDGGGSIDGRSGQQIVSDLTKIVNQINSGKSTVPKVQLKFDTSHAKTALQELRSQLQEIAGMGNISVSGMSSRGGSGGSAGVKQDAENYRALTATVKKYYAALAEVEKIQMKSTAVSSSGGVWSTADKQYDARIKKVNQLKMDFDRLQLAAFKGGRVEIASAQQLNITEEQRAMLLAQVKSAITANGLAHEKSAAQISATWDKNAAKVHEYILRIQDVASKNAEVNALMTELNTLAASGNPQNLDELTAKFAKLQQIVRKTEADVKTWGDRFQKAFGNQVRSVLATAITTLAAKTLRDLYNNVVELDKAMTDLQIASGKSREEIRELTKSYSALAKEIGATTNEVAKSADTWLRQGYDAEATNTLIKNSTMLAKLGQMEAAEASKALTSAMKGYKVEVKDSIGIVDKFTAVDMEAAASAGDIATAMAETATSANIAGISMDRLIGYLAVVKEVTQDGAESVGTFYKTLFARMNNVKAGKFVDEETGEALNDVEKVLGQLGISLRDANGLFRNSGDVLDEVGHKWENFDNVQQHAIATAFAGTKQQEKFIVLMENYETAMDYAAVASESAGTAMDKFKAHTESIRGKLESLTATFEEFSITILNSELVVFVVELLQGVLEVLSFADGFIAKTAIVIALLAALKFAVDGLSTAFSKQKAIISGGFKNFLLYIQYVKAMATSNGVATAMIDLQTAAIIKQYTTGFTGLLTFIPRAIAAIGMWIASMFSAKTATISFKAALDSLNVNPTMLAISAVVLALVGAVELIKKFSNDAAEASAAAKEHAQAMQEEANKAEEELDALDELIRKYEELRSKGNMDDDTRKEILDVQKQINALVHGEAKEWDALNGELDDNLKKLRELRAEKAKENLSKHQQAYVSAQASANSAYVSDRSDTEWSDINPYIFQTDLVVDGWDYDATEILRGIEGITVSTTSSLAGLSTYIDFEAKTAEEYVAQIKAAMDALAADDAGYDELHSRIYAKLDSLRLSYEEYTAAATQSADTLLENVVIVSGWTEEANGAAISSSEEYNRFKQSIIDAAWASEFLQEAIESQAVSQEDVNKAVNDYISINHAELYNKYENAVKGVTVQLQSTLDILDKVQAGFDGIVSALKGVTADGYLTADALSTLLQLEKENALAGLSLADILTRDINGYKLAEDALQKYINALIGFYKVQGPFATEKDKQNAIAHLEILRAVLATLINTQDEATDASKAYREELEKDKEVYEDQLDKFNELIDLRKDLLQTYQEELNYQKELEKRQRNVTALQTKLSVARLDGSAAGQARVRELEAELKEAQDDLEDFTLEHAIDVLTDQLDSTNAEWKAIIQGKLDEITTLLNGLDNKPEVNITIDKELIQDAMNKLDGAITTTTNQAVVPSTPPQSQQSTPTTAGNSTTYSAPTKGGVTEGTGFDILPSTISKKEYGNITRTVDGVTYINLQDLDSLNYPFPWQADWWAKWGEGYSITDKDDGNYTIDIHSFKPIYKFHQGGIVEGTNSLHSTEVFAKLLKGEFVSTPAQMKHFMEETLPQIANYSASGSRNEFNAPLITIACESVTTEAMPELERVVNDAVREIKKQLDSGMSRTGFKRTPTKRLT